jgi:aspartyl-tRNA(Asn)/glutamyl-tRNA(Gln) amidotransferase subunit B
MKYEIVIGLEVHAELSTRSKIFCSCSTQFGGDVNTQCCPICIGLPGTLPMLNEKVVEYAIMAGLALNCTISAFSKMDRKNYFYPDLPKSYQISQFDLPLCINGHVDIEMDGVSKRIGITRIHIEEDAGKLVHDQCGTGSLVDYNRGGVPLIEIVTEPDFRSSGEVKEFLETIRQILRYIGVSDCKMEQGSLRADVNISVRPFGQQEFGTRVEIKNLNSFKAVVEAIESESSRLINILESGGTVTRETRRWDDEKGESYPMREKEEAHDYRYFPEPDLLPIEPDPAWVEELRKSLPELPGQRKRRYMNELGLPEYDSELITSSRSLADFFEGAVTAGGDPKQVSNWIMGDIMKTLNERNIAPEDIPFPPSYLTELLTLINNGTISGRMAKDVFVKMFDSRKRPSGIVKEEGLAVVSNENELLDIIRRVIDANPGSVEDYRMGKTKALGFLVGQVMKETGGKADPKLANKLLSDELAR